MGKAGTDEKLQKLLEKKVKFNRVEIQFNDKSMLIDYITPKKAAEQSIIYLFKVIEYFKYIGSILNVGSDKYKHIDIRKYFAHPMLRSELFNIEKNLLLYGGTIKYGGRVYVEIAPSPIWKDRLVIQTKTAWNKDDFFNTLDSLTSSFKFKTSAGNSKRLNEIIDEKIALEQKLREEKREEFLRKRKKELEEKIEQEKERLARLEEEERIRQEEEKENQMREWRLNNKLFPIADLASINWDKRWMDDFDVITCGIANIKIKSVEDEEYLRDYCDKVIDFIIHLDVYTIRNDPDIKNLMIRRIHESKKDAIMKLLEPEPIIDELVEVRLQELVKQLPTAPMETAAKPKPIIIEDIKPVPIDEAKPVPIEDKEESKKKIEERKQREVPLFD